MVDGDYAARVFAAEIGEVDVGSNRSRDALKGTRAEGRRPGRPVAPRASGSVPNGGSRAPACAKRRRRPPDPHHGGAAAALLAAIKRPAHADRGAVTMSDDDESAEIEEDISIAASDGGLSAGEGRREGAARACRRETARARRVRRRT